MRIKGYEECLNHIVEIKMTHEYKSQKKQK